MSEELEPWEDPKYLDNHAPRCIKRFAWKLMAAGEKDVYEREFSLACECGHASGHVLG